MELQKNEQEFLLNMGVKLADFEKSGLCVSNLMEIAQDYKNNELTLLDEAEYIAKKVQRCDSVHSVRWRIKSTSHLIKKIVRKLSEEKPSEKYKEINADNYKSIITDLIGVRAIYLFKSDWEEVHKHILSRWVLKENEPVVIYHREGDIMDIYSNYKECKQEKHIYDYRSIHYIIPVAQINSKEVFCEIQTRTIFEEGWSEIDHKVRYPDYSEDEDLKNYLKIFNRLAGSADEMASYVSDLVALIKKNNSLEEEREQKDKAYLEEKEQLQSDIEKLSSDGKNLAKMKEAFEKYIEVQDKQILSLKSELKSKLNENMILNRKEPMVQNITQETSVDNGVVTGLISFDVLRPNNHATFTANFDYNFESCPEVEIEIESVHGIQTSIDNLVVRAGAAKESKFNAHLFNKELGYVEEGKYCFKFKAWIA